MANTELEMTRAEARALAAALLAAADGVCPDGKSRTYVAAPVDGA